MSNKPDDYDPTTQPFDEPFHHVDQPEESTMDVLDEWTPELEMARIDLCKFLVITAAGVAEIFPSLSTRLIEAEAALTLLADIIERAKEAPYV